MSPAFMRASPTRKARMPASISRSISALFSMPLSLTTTRPAGIRAASSMLVRRSVLKVLRSRLLMPMIPAPAAMALAAYTHLTLPTNREV